MGIRLSIAAAVVFALVSCGRDKNGYDASGTFEATEIIVSSEANGRIMRLDVLEGQRVREGEVLGYIDTVQLHLTKLQLLSSMQAVGSRRQDVNVQIAYIQEQIATQVRERDRVRNLLAANAANQKQLDDISSGIAVLEKQLEATKTNLESGNQSIYGESSAIGVQVAQIEDQIAKSVIRAPIDGTILVKYAEAEEVTAQGRPLFKIADTDNMILRAYITSGQLTQLKIGEKVSVFADYGESGNREYTGEVTWISDKSEFTPKTIQTRDERANLVYAIKIAVRNDGLLKIGMYADVRFQ